MTSLVLHNTTATALQTYIQHPSHATMLVGSDGIGKGSIAAYLVRSVLALPATAAMAASAKVKLVAPDDKNTISIEAIRGIQSFVRLKTAGTATLRRAIIIEHASHMTTEAQNALLKVLEEPPADTIIILTVAQVHDMLPTIQSRAQSLIVTPPTKQQLLQHFAAGTTPTTVMQSYFLSGGLPGLMTALLEGDKDHPLAQSVALAKGLLQGQLFEKLTFIEGVAKQRESAISLCEALARIAQAGLNQAVDKNDTTRIKQWKTILEESSRAKDSLLAHANTKLALTNLVLQL